MKTECLREDTRVCVSASVCVRCVNTTTDTPTHLHLPLARNKNKRKLLLIEFLNLRVNFVDSHSLSFTLYLSPSLILI